MKKSEDRIQQECYRWFHNTYPELRGLLFHVPNGGKRDGREAKKLKTMGVVPGVADLIFLYNGRRKSPHDGRCRKGRCHGRKEE
jgi:hypothetical protein